MIDQSNKFYQRKITDPQANPPPMASVNKRSPFLSFFSLFATDIARGIEAAEVFPWLWTVTIIFDKSMPSYREVDFIIRRFA